jgi:hypothetical protein
MAKSQYYRQYCIPDNEFIKARHQSCAIEAQLG